MTAKFIGDAIGGAGFLHPRVNAEGEIQFSPITHALLLERSDLYRAWWEALDDIERARLDREVEKLDEAERAAAREADEKRRLATEAAAKAREQRGRTEPLARMQRRGVPAKDLSAIASGQLDMTQALIEARDLLVSPDHRILVLSGPKGCGKTTAAGWLVAQDVPGPPSYDDEPRGHPEPRFLDVSKLARLSRYKAEEVEPLETCTLLVIDDLGMEYADEKGSFLATLDGVFNARYAAGLYTVITTNLPAKTFKERYGERIADRIREVGRFVELNGKSLRGRREP